MPARPAIDLTSPAQRARADLLARCVRGFAHEINNPLAIVQMLASSLVDGDPPTPAELPELGSQINDSARRIGRIIRCLRLLSPGRDDGPAMPIDPDELVADAVEAGRIAMLHLRPHVVVNRLHAGRSLRLREPPVGFAIVSLVVNALEAGGEGASVRVTVLPSATELVVTVDDDGPGIADALVSRVFDAGVTDRSGRAALGLGLTVARELAVAQGGTLTLESPRNPTRFTLHIPAATT